MVRIAEDNIVVTLPALSARRGRILEIILGRNLLGNQVTFATVNTSPGDFIYQANQPRTTSVDMDIRPLGFGPFKLRLRSTVETTGDNVWFNTDQVLSYAYVLITMGKKFNEK